MHYVLRVIRACCAPSGSLPQDRQKSTSRKRKARDSCWGKMHLSAWLKAIINCHGVWNVEEWSLWRNWIVYLFTVLFLIFCANEQNEAFFTRITHDLIYFFFSEVLCAVVFHEMFMRFSFTVRDIVLCVRSSGIGILSWPSTPVGIRQTCRRV